MKRFESAFLDKIGFYISGKDVLEIGCGDGTRLHQIIGDSRSWTGIDPDSESVRLARAHNALENVEFVECGAEQLPWPDSSYDVVLFTLSLHHIPMDAMPTAIAQAQRVTRTSGRIIFVEPLPEGTFYEAEMSCGCCDGDERKQLAFAFYSMLNAGGYREVEEFVAQVSVEYESFEDFMEHVPTVEETLEHLKVFLESHSFTLNEKWRLNAFEVPENYADSNVMGQI